MDKKATLYEWCLINDIRILNLGENEGDWYMLEEIHSNEFNELIEKYEIKTNSIPYKPEKFLELRMYGLVPYNLSPIQQGIQFNHANDVYSHEWGTGNERYDWFRTEWMTNILLNGGTSNEGHYIRHGFKNIWYVGSMQQHLSDLTSNGVRSSTFNEPDLNSMLTAIVFLVDERVFNKKLYPNYEPSIFEGETGEEFNEWSIEEIRKRAEWLNIIGGPKNEFLREFLYNKKLA